MQLGLILIVYGVIFNWSLMTFQVDMPNNQGIFFCRILAIFLMHLQIEPFYNLGLDMMKFAKNHPDQFRSFGMAFTVGFIVYTTTLATEICGVYYLSSISTIIDIVAKQVAIFFLIRVSEFYALSLGKTSKLLSDKGKESLMKVTKYRQIADQVKMRDD